MKAHGYISEGVCPECKMEEKQQTVEICAHCGHVYEKVKVAWWEVLLILITIIFFSSFVYVMGHETGGWLDKLERVLLSKSEVKPFMEFRSPHSNFGMSIDEEGNLYIGPMKPFAEIEPGNEGEILVYDEEKKELKWTLPLTDAKQI